jgi:hypothetical protein
LANQTWTVAWFVTSQRKAGIASEATFKVRILPWTASRVVEVDDVDVFNR